MRMTKLHYWPHRHIGYCNEHKKNDDTYRWSKTTPISIQMLGLKVILWLDKLKVLTRSRRSEEMSRRESCIGSNISDKLRREETNKNRIIVFDYLYSLFTIILLHQGSNLQFFEEAGSTAVPPRAMTLKEVQYVRRSWLPFQGRIHVWSESAPAPPFWQINHANSAYFRLFLGYFQVISATRPLLLDLAPLFTYPGSAPAFHTSSAIL